MLDMQTAVVASILVDIALVTSSLSVYLKHRGHMKTTLHWLVAFSATLAGHSLLLLRVAIPGELFVITGKLFLAIGIGGAVAGAAEISGRKAPYSIVIAVLAAYIFLDTMFGLGFRNPQLRAMITSATVATGSIIGWACLAFPREAANTKALARGAGAFAALAALYAGHFAAVLIFGGDNAWFRHSDRDALFFLASLAVFVGIGFGYLGMIEGLLSDELARSAEVNALLLKEIRHRSKNDLALISSLVSLQADAVKDANAKAVLGDLQDRIRTIAAVYRLFSKSEGFSRADAGDYLNAVVAGIRNGAGARRNIAFSVNADRIELPSNQLIPLGLIVNELITNAVKHAFPEGHGGSVGVEIRESENKVSLTVTDDGVGTVPAEGTRGGIGLSLTQALASQLHGSLAIDSAPGTGTRCSINFAIG